jgi:hypothetical protein
MRTIKIAQRFFDELLQRGDTVPRDSNGNTFIAIVSENYILKSEDGKQALARCTQDCPVNFRLIEIITTAN